ncbi:hypothetical protein PIB30_080725 [Stylosanthes scabra]|uniref:Glycosyltransferase n=1 Tax=Stylosanthes scabra TaxID=79078 RepID=A0ABU6SRM9_9FABA|nr:hypothetical protein [Stylosanthes scabra]
MLPLLAQGHLIPFLALARQIQQTTPSFKITIATTPLNIQLLKHHHIHNHIHFAELPLNPNAENTEKPPLDGILKLCQASLISKIKEQEGYPPLSYISVWSNLPHINSDSDKFSVQPFPQDYKFSSCHMPRYLREANGSNDWSRFLVSQLSLSMKSDGWICNTVEEVETLGLDLLRKYIHLPIWSLGPLRPLPLKGKETSMASDEECIEWLNLKDQRSVLCICFGSQNTISTCQMMALAEGLEKSETSFIWVVRPPLGFDINGEFNAHEWLPKGFEERIKNAQKGLLVHQWGPQMKILSHKSIAAFVSHCGWNSVLESLSCGVPIIGWPLAAEQAYNAKMLDEELGVGVILTATVESVVSNEEVKNVTEMVMDQESVMGKEMKGKKN